MTERQQERHPRARTCSACRSRVIWPDGFPSPNSPVCSRCDDKHEHAITALLDLTDKEFEQVWVWHPVDGWVTDSEAGAVPYGDGAGIPDTTPAPASGATSDNGSRERQPNPHQNGSSAPTSDDT